MLPDDTSPPADAPRSWWHPALANPPVVAMLALVAGHGWAAATGFVGWHAAAAVACVAGALMLVARPRGLHFVALFCVLFLSIGGLMESRHLANQRASHAAMGTMLGEDTAGLLLAQVSGQLSDFPRRTPTGWTLLLGPGAAVESRGVTVRSQSPVAIRLRLQDGSDAVDLLVPGDSMLAVGRLELLPAGRFAWGPGEGGMALGRAVAIVHGRHWQAHGLDQRGPWRWVLSEARRLGARAEALMRGALPEPQAAVLVSMTLGRTHLLAPEQRQTFRRAGIYHVFAVSGLHVMLVGGVLLAVLRGMALPIAWRLLLLAAFLLAFCALQGLRPSVMRAASLLLLFEALPLLKRPVEPLGALAAVALAMALASPGVVWQVDYQMSFLCVVALMLAAPWAIEWRQWVGSRLGWGAWSGALVWGGELLLGSTAISIMLAPVMAAWFGEISLISPVGNLLLLAPAALLIKGAFGCLLVAAMVAGGAALVGWLAWPIGALEHVAAMLSAMPGAAINSTPWGIPSTVAVYTLIVAGPWARLRRPQQPRRTAHDFIPALLALALLLVAGPAGWLAPPSRALDVWFLDVGQGDATVIRTPTGATMLVDAGPPSMGARVVGELRRLGVTRIDALVATHADADHIGGMAAVVNAFPVMQMVVGGSLAETGAFDDLVEAVDRRGVWVSTVRRGASLRMGGQEFTVLHPTDDFVAGDDARNDASIVLHTVFGGKALLLVGDAEINAERDMIAGGGLPRADVLKCGHHGAGTSTSGEFLDAIAPAHAIISCGRLNRYGHPAPRVLDDLINRSVEVHRTDRDGTIHLRIDQSGRMTWREARWMAFRQ